MARTAACPRCFAKAMGAWAPLAANRNAHARLAVLTGNTHRSTCAACGAVEHKSEGMSYADGTGFRVVK